MGKLIAIPVTELELDELKFLVETGDPLDDKYIDWCQHLDKEQRRCEKHQWRQGRRDEFDEYHLDSDDEEENAMEIDINPYLQMMLARVKADGESRAGGGQETKTQFYKRNAVKFRERREMVSEDKFQCLNMMEILMWSNWKYGPRFIRRPGPHPTDSDHAKAEWAQMLEEERFKKAAREETRLAQQAELERAQQDQKLDGDPELMHDQELLANVADAHMRGFQKLMNPDPWFCTHCNFCDNEFSAVVAHELNCVRAKAPKRSKGKGKGGHCVRKQNPTEHDVASRAAARKCESIARIHHHYKQLEQQPVPSGGFDSAKIQCEYDNVEWDERGFGYNWQNHLNDERILLEYPEHRYAHRALNVMFNSK